MTNHNLSPLTPDELRTRTTIRLWPDCGLVMGLSKNSTYAAAKSGQIVTLRIGQKWLVPVGPLLTQLGLEPNR